MCFDLIWFDYVLPTYAAWKCTCWIDPSLVRVNSRQVSASRLVSISALVDCAAETSQSGSHQQCYQIRGMRSRFGFVFLTRPTMRLRVSFNLEWNISWSSACLSTCLAKTFLSEKLRVFRFLVLCVTSIQGSLFASRTPAVPEHVWPSLFRNESESGYDNSLHGKCKSC